MPLFTLEGVLCAVFAGYFAIDLKLHITKVKENKKRLLVFGIISGILYIGNILLNIFVIKETGFLIWDMAIPAIVFTIYYNKQGNRENNELTKRIKAKPEIKKSNTYFVIFLICYILFPFVAFAIYSLISGNSSVTILNEDLGKFTPIFIIYVAIFFVACILSFRTFKKHYLIEKNKKTDEIQGDEIKK